MRRLLVLTAVGCQLSAALLAGCAEVRQGRTGHDDFRDSCAAAARAHLIASDQAARGAMTPTAFAALDDAFDAIAASCRRSLGGTNEHPAG